MCWFGLNVAGVWLITLAMLAAPLGVSAQEPNVSVLRIDGTLVTGSWVGVREANVVTIRTGDDTVAIPLSDAQRITFRSDSTGDSTALPSDTAGYSSEDADESVVLHFMAGGRLIAHALRGHDERVVADSLLGTKVDFPIDRLAGLAFTTDPAYEKARDRFVTALRDRRPADDVLVTRDVKEPKVLRGRVERFGASEVSFVFGGRSRTAQWEKLYGIVFATGGVHPAAVRAMIELTDGSRIPGRVRESDESTLRFDASIGSTVTFALDTVRAITLHSDRITYVSDLPIARQTVNGILHRPWPIRLDGNLRGGPLFIGGRRFEHGIACHSRTELTYKLDEPYDVFAATIGLDDAVRPRGSVVFRLLSAGTVLFDSGPVTGTDEPRSVLIKISGINELTLLVDYGEGLDLSDQADWGGARLIRPASSEPGVQ